MSEGILFGLDLAALPQGAAVMTGLSAATQPHWARLITDSSPTGELCGVTWHHSTRFSSRLPLGLCWQWISLEFTLPVNKSPLTKPMGIDGSLEVLFSSCMLHLFNAVCSCDASALCGRVCTSDRRKYACICKCMRCCNLPQYLIRWCRTCSLLRRTEIYIFSENLHTRAQQKMSPLCCNLCLYQSQNTDSSDAVAHG